MRRDAFLARREVPAAEHDALERALEAAIVAGGAAWPRVKLDADTFAAFLAEHAGWPLDGVRAEALWLTCACARGDAEAISAFERAYFAEIDAAAGQLGAAHLADELKARLRERLFTGARAVAGYRGRGDPARWLRTVAARAAIDLLRQSRDVPVEDLADRGLPDSDPELLLLKERYGKDFKAAVREALAGLEPAVRSDLKLYYLDGVGLSSLAAMYRVSIATMSRRLARTREAVLASTREIMRQRLGIEAADVDSILRLIESRLELSRSALDH